jgi:hypothetical protein
MKIESALGDGLSEYDNKGTISCDEQQRMNNQLLLAAATFSCKPMLPDFG